METKLNIAEILKDKPKGTKLYSSLFGDMYLSYVKSGIINMEHHGVITKFYDDGKYFSYPGSEPLLFPSKEMRDWSKFAWKKGDVLVSKGRRTLHVIFEGFNDDAYTTFKGKHYICDYSSKENCDDEEYYNDYHKEVEEQTIEFEKDNVNNAQIYINIIEKRLDGKLNRDTLEIEKTQPEFKDGDIIVTAGAPYLYYSKCIIILKGDLYTKDNKAHSYAFYNINNKFIDFDIIDTRIRDREIRLATDSEKLQLFDMLTKEGKYWDTEKKQIVDLKPKWTPKPFDRVITRDDDDDVWIANIFSHMDSHGGYVPIGCVSGYLYCIPYNEETAKLIGTKNNMEC